MGRLDDPATPDSHTSTTSTHATWYSDDPSSDNRNANVLRVNAVHHRKYLCILDSGSNRIVFNHDSRFDNTNSIPLTLTNTEIYGISGAVNPSMQTIVGNSPILMCPYLTDNVLSQGWSGMTMFDSIDNIYRIVFGNTYSTLK